MKRMLGIPVSNRPPAGLSSSSVGRAGGARRSTRGWRLVAAVSMVGVLAACGRPASPIPPASTPQAMPASQQQLATPTPAGSSGSTATSAMELLQASAKAMTGVQSWRAQMDMMIAIEARAVEAPPDTTLGGAKVGDHPTSEDKSSFFMSSDVSYVLDHGMTMAATMRSSQAGPTDMKFGMIVVGKDVYVRVGDQKWVLLDATTAEQVEAEKMLGRQYQAGLPFVSDTTPWEAFKAEDMGREQVDGVSVRHIAYEFEMGKVWGAMSLDEKQTLANFYLPDELAPQDIDLLAGMMHVDKIELFVDDAGFSRRTVMDISVDDPRSDQGVITVWMDLRMSRFNEDLPIEAPKEFQTMEDMIKQKEQEGGAVSAPPAK